MIPATDESALALTTIGEARGEGDAGMIAVAWTAKNRVAAHSWFGDTITEACLKPYQYSCWNENDPNRAYLEGIAEDDPMYEHALILALGVIHGDITDNTNGATHYYAKGTPMPKWATDKHPCAIIGHHLFFKGIA